MPIAYQHAHMNTSSSHPVEWGSCPPIEEA
jgi:hypothetical protein